MQARFLSYLLIPILVSSILFLLQLGNSQASTSSTLLRHSKNKISSSSKGGRGGGIVSVVIEKLSKRGVGVGETLASRGGGGTAITRAFTSNNIDPSSPLSSSYYSSISATAGLVVGNSAVVVRSGFRQFSQRATRLQGRAPVRKPFSLKSIFGDVVTNNNNSDGGGALEKDNDQRFCCWSPPPSVVKKRIQPFLTSLTSIVATGANEAVGGFMGGYILGGATFSTKRLYSAGLQRTFSSSFLHGRQERRPKIISTQASTTTVIKNPLPFPSIAKTTSIKIRSKQYRQQFHSHNMVWAKEWAKISAIFGACRMLVKTLRQHDYDDENDDGWNSVVGSTIAGAILAIPPTMSFKSRRIIMSTAAAAATASSIPTTIIMRSQAIVRNALLYGGTMFLLHPNLWWKQQHGGIIETFWLLTTPPSQRVATTTTTTSTTTTRSDGRRSTSSIDQQPWYDRIDYFL